MALECANATLTPVSLSSCDAGHLRMAATVLATGTDRSLVYMATQLARFSSSRKSRDVLLWATRPGSGLAKTLFVMASRNSRRRSKGATSTPASRRTSAERSSYEMDPVRGTASAMLNSPIACSGM